MRTERKHIPAQCKQHLTRPNKLAMSAPWEEISARKRQERDSKIPNEWRLASVDPARINVTDVPRESGILTAAELNITEDYEAKGIVAAVAEGTLKAEAVAIAFCKVRSGCP